MPPPPGMGAAAVVPAAAHRGVDERPALLLGKSHVMVSLGVAAVRAGRKVRYFTAADLADTLYRGLADNSVGKVIETLLRNDLILVDEVGFAPLDDTGAYCAWRGGRSAWR